jgi:hypothetical protein
LTYSRFGDAIPCWHNQSFQVRGPVKHQAKVFGFSLYNV